MAKQRKPLFWKIWQENKSQLVKRLSLFILFFFGSELAISAPAFLTYQGRIVKSDGQPLQNPHVSFLFEITSPNGSCVLYREQTNGINMVNSNGVFDVPIGQSHTFPASPTFNVLDSFNNSAPLSCAGGATYNPILSDGRLLRVQFYDGSAWRVIAPDTVIRSVPYAAYSESSNRLGTHFAMDFILRNEVNGNTSCDGGSFLTWNSTTQTFGCHPAPTGGGGGGPTGTASGDLGGNYPAPILAKIQGVGVDLSTPPTTGQVLTFDGVNWVADDAPLSAGGTVTSVATGTGLTGGPITGSGTIGLGASLLGLHNVATNGYIQRTGAGSYSTTLGATTSSSNTLVVRDGSGVGSFTGVDLSGGTGTATWMAPSVVTTYSLTLPNAQGSANQVMVNNGSGILSWANMPSAPGAACGTGNVLTYNGTSFTCVPDQVGSAGGGVANLNGQTGSSQSFMTGTGGTAPAFSSASDVHTLNIPYARDNAVTAGLISKAEYNSFQGKQDSLGFTPLRPSNNLSELTDVTAAQTHLGLGTAALKNVPASGNASATEVVLGNDTRLSNSRAPSGNAGGDLALTYPNPEVARLKGVALSISGLSNGQFLKYNGVNWINSVLNLTDVTGLSTALDGKLSHSQITGPCTAGSTLVFTSVSGAWTCTAIAVTDAQITYASKSAKTFLAAPSGGAGTPSFRTIATADLPSSVTDGLWTVNGADISRPSGNVGIGISAPEARLVVAGSGRQLAVGQSASSWADISSASGGAAYFGSNGYISANKFYFSQDHNKSGGIGSRGIAINYPLWGDQSFVSTEGVTIKDIEFTPTVLMTVKSSGYVGIGTTNPTALLHVVSEASMRQVARFSGYDAINNNSYIEIINTSSTPGGAGIFVESGTSSGFLRYSFLNKQWQFYTEGGTADKIRMSISNSGSVGIGTTSPSATLHVAQSTAGVTARFTNSAGTCSLTPSSSAANWACSSDERLKTGVQNISGEDVLERMQGLKAVTYTLKKGDDGRRHTGYIAQNVREVAAEFVTADETGTLQVSYTGFIPWLTEGLKTLHLKVLKILDAHERQNQELVLLRESHRQLEKEILAQKRELEILKQHLEKMK